ncbi:MAG: HEAT repeat domain-containing protein [Phycisphaerae bacterium]|nr:HEAT repeat domain-containing protein [Phycisphaerae bacterium]
MLTQSGLLLALAGLAIVLGLLLVARGMWGDRANGRARCRKCWYSLEGIASLRCPECGWTAPSSNSVFASRRRWRLVLLGLLLGAGAPVALAVKRGWRPEVPTHVAILAVGWTDAKWPSRIIFDRVVSQAGCFVTYESDALSPSEIRSLAAQCARRAQSGSTPSVRADGLALLELAETCGSVGDISWPTRTGAIADADASVRHAAIQGALHTIDTPPAFVAAVGRAIDDRETMVRHAALEYLGRCTSAPESLLPAIIARLDDQQQIIRAAASEALRSFGPAARGAASRLAEIAANDPVDYVRVGAMESLGAVGPSAAFAVPMLRENLRSPNWAYRHAAAQALGTIGQEARETLPDLDLLAERKIALPPVDGRDNDSDVAYRLIADASRESAIRIRLACGEPLENPGLAVATVKLRREEVEAAVRSGADRSVMAQVLRGQLTQLQWYLRRDAVIGLATLGSNDPDTISALRTAVGDSDLVVSASATIALDVLGEADALSKIEVLLASGDARAALQLGSASREFPETRTRLVTHLKAAVASRHPVTRAMAAGALCRCEGPRAEWIAELRRAMASDDGTLREAAFDLLRD